MISFFSPALNLSSLRLGQLPFQRLLRGTQFFATAGNWKRFFGVYRHQCIIDDDQLHRGQAPNSNPAAEQQEENLLTDVIWQR